MKCYIANGTVYAVPVRSGELYHHGVKGMKWGVRRYQNKDGSLTNAGRKRYGSSEYYEEKSRAHASAVDTSKTRLGKSYHNYRAYRNEVKTGNRKALETISERGIIKNIDNLYGHGASARVQNAASKYYERKSGYTKTALGTSMAKANAYNAKTAAAANTRLHNAKSISDYGTNYVNALANRSIKTWSGRTTTTGKQFVDGMLTAGTFSTIADLRTYSKKRSDAKNAYRDRTDKAFKEYESTISDIEKNYKRGQNLSKEDQAREAAAEEKYANETAKAKADYKKLRRSGYE